MVTGGGKVGIGMVSPGNILTVVQNFATDPIADGWTTYSSRRWKENITALDGRDALQKIMQLQAVRFNWKSNGKHDIGLIAEDVGKVVPEAIEYEENSGDAKGLNYDKLVPLLLEAIKELEAENDALKVRIDLLEGKIK